MNTNDKKKILLSGGGTAGSVTPLLALAEEMEGVEFFWIGTEGGPEKDMVGTAKIKFQSISSGKLRRYFSFDNFFDVFRIFFGFFESFSILNKFKPDLVVTAGAYVSVPVVWAAWLKNIPVIVHQQDARAGLANKLMAPFAKKVTVTFEKSKKDYGDKAVVVGNPVRKEFRENKIDKRTARQKLGLRSEKPIVLIMGGGTGAMAINRLVRESIDDLTKFCQVIHLTGKDKALDFATISSKNADYKNFEFLNTEGMIKVFTVADAVVSRCGMATLTELCYFQKSSILIPMPDSHQEDNAEVFKNAQAASVLSQNALEKSEFCKGIKKIINDGELRGMLRGNIKSVIRSEHGLLVNTVSELINKKSNNI